MRLNIQPRLKRVLSFRTVATGIAFIVCFTVFYMYFNFGRSFDSKAGTSAMTGTTGNWSSSSTWSLSRVPADSDTLTIPAGKTVTVDVVTQSYVHMFVKVYGTLHFLGGKKIVMCDGQLQVFSGGLLTGDNTGSKINICNSMVWDGSDPGSGPLYFNSGNLPIELVSFDAKASANGVELTWETANEINNDYFTIERAEDGDNFTPLKRINGAGNSTSTLNYSSTDTNPIEGLNYYRLKQTDYDGKYTYSGIKSVRFDNSIPANIISIQSVISNPLVESVTVHYSAKADGNVSMALINSTGSIVESETLHAMKGNNTYQLMESTTLSGGLYFIRLVMNNEAETRKFIKS